MSDALKEIEKFRRDKLLELLTQCTPGQQNLFNLMYPEGIYNLSTEKIDWAIQQCERTIVKNKSDEGQGASKIFL